MNKSLTHKVEMDNYSVILLYLFSRPLYLVDLNRQVSGGSTRLNINFNEPITRYYIRAFLIFKIVKAV
jgi:hypothetical protein